MTLPVFKDDISDDEMDAMVANATTASNFMKAISHEGRLMILCHLVNGEKSVTELEDLLSARQAAVSQQLSRLRLEGWSYQDVKAKPSIIDWRTTVLGVYWKWSTISSATTKPECGSRSGPANRYLRRATGHARTS